MQPRRLAIRLTSTSVSWHWLLCTLTFGRRVIQHSLARASERRLPQHRADRGLSQPAWIGVQFAGFKPDIVTRYNYCNNLILSGSVKHSDTVAITDKQLENARFS